MPHGMAKKQQQQHHLRPVGIKEQGSQFHQRWIRETNKFWVPKIDSEFTNFFYMKVKVA